MGPLNEVCALHITRQVLLALSYLHANGIIHRDIKAANILLNERAEVKLGDFGVASQVMSTFRRTSFVGSPYWMAPEVIKRNQYDSKADIWSLGITIYELVRGEPPLAQVEPARAICVIPTCAPPRLDSSYGEALRELVAACLHDDPNKRPSADELLRGKILRKSLQAITKSPLDSLIAQYRSIRRNNSGQTAVDDATSLIGADNGDGNTVKSAWTFGTCHSSDEERHKDDGDDTKSESIPETDAVDEAKRDPFGEHLRQLADSLIDLDAPPNTAAPNTVMQRDSSTMPRSMTPSSVSFSTNAGTPAVSLSRTRSLSIQSLGGFSMADSFSDSASRLLTSSPQHRRVKSSGSGTSSGSLDHLSNPIARKAPSLLNLPPICDDGDPLCLLAREEAARQQKIREKLDLTAWPHQVPVGEDHDRSHIYQLMTRLKQFLLDIPPPTDPRDTCECIRARIMEHIKYAEACLARVKEANELLSRLGNKE